MKHLPLTHEIMLQHMFRCAIILCLVSNIAVFLPHKRQLTCLFAWIAYLFLVSLLLEIQIHNERTKSNLQALPVNLQLGLSNFLHCTTIVSHKYDVLIQQGNMVR
jgi:uncharacterized protein involved in response to NO